MNQEACPRCGAPRAAATPFCTNCGAPFQGPEATPPGDAPTMVAGGQPGGQDPAWGAPGAGQSEGPGGQWGPPAQPGGAPAPGQWGPPQGSGDAGGPGQWGPPQGPGGPGQWGPGPQAGGPGGGGFNPKIAAIVAVVVLLLVGGGITAAILLTGDDDDDSKSGDDSPTTATVEEFCSEWQKLQEYDDTTEDGFRDGMEHLESLRSLGTPEDMPEEAREGFEVYMDWAAEADDADDFESMDGISEEDQAKMRAFFSYQGETCAEKATASPSSVPTDLPSDLPTDVPTDLPTDMPTDFPTDFNPSDYGLDEDQLKQLEELESMLSEYPTP